MKTASLKFLLPTGVFLLLIGGFIPAAVAQVQQNSNITYSDTSQIRRKIQQQNQHILKHFNFDRSIHKYLSPESNRFNVPSSGKNQRSTASVQKHLNAAMKVLRKQLKNSVTTSRFYRILTKIAPYINNAFVFGYYNKGVHIMPPDNPYLYPQTLKGQKTREHILKRVGADKGNNEQE